MLAKAFEEARIAEARDIPVLTVIDSAVTPVRRSFPRRKLNVVLGLMLGGLLGLAASIFLDHGRSPHLGRGSLTARPRVPRYHR